MPLLFVTDCFLHVDSPLQKPTYYFTFKMSKSIKVIGTTNTIKPNVYELQKKLLLYGKTQNGRIYLEFVFFKLSISTWSLLIRM